MGEHFGIASVSTVVIWRGNVEGLILSSSCVPYPAFYRFPLRTCYSIPSNHDFFDIRILAFFLGPSFFRSIKGHRELQNTTHNHYRPWRSLSILIPWILQSLIYRPARLAGGIARRLYSQNLEPYRSWIFPFVPSHCLVTNRVHSLKRLAVPWCPMVMWFQ